MLATHLYALIPLMVILVLSMAYFGRGLIHIMGLAYVITLSFMAIGNTWEIMFFPILAISGIIFLILFIYAMLNGGWL